MIDTNNLRRLAQAVDGRYNFNQVWIDPWRDTPVVVVGYIGEGGDLYPVVAIDCDSYYAEGQSLPLGEFYAAANPATVSELINRLEAVEKERDVLRDRLALESQENGALRDSVDRACEERDALLARIEEMEKQEPLHADSDVFRSAFEAVIKAGNWSATRQGDGYRAPSTQIAWRIAFSTVNRLKLYLAPDAGAGGEQ